jgi:hypothetical protein
VGPSRSHGGAAEITARTAALSDASNRIGLFAAERDLGDSRAKKNSARGEGWWNTPLMGALNSAATVGVGLAIQIFATQGGRGVVRASDSGGTHDPATYTANFNRAQSGLVRVVNELLWRGVSYEQLGALPVSGDWAMKSLDAGGTPLEILNRSPRAAAFKREGMGLAG